MSTAPTLDAIRACLEGVIPATIATAAPDGTPNVSLLSQVHYVDPDHIALSYQFFNKTRANILLNPDALLQVIDPPTGAQYRMRLSYLRTETAGPLFESMKAKLSGIASHVGMAEVFRLLGADLFRVTAIEAVPGYPLPAPVRPRSLLSATRRACEGLRGCTDLSDLLDRAVSALHGLFGVEHALILLPDASSGRLFTVAALGYDGSGRGTGIGWEVTPGDGVIGVAARERVPIRITHMTTDVAYSMAMRRDFDDGGAGPGPLREIPFPGLERPHSQLAVPILAHEAGPSESRLAGVLFVESAQEMRFTYDDEDALATLAAQIGVLMRGLPAAHTAEGKMMEEAPVRAASVPLAGGVPVTVRHYATDDSVFLDHDYLIKGVAGAILWKLVRDHTMQGRTDFTNRELRLAPDIPLPDFAENLEARLILLQRRLDDRCGALRIEKTGRGRFRLLVAKPLLLEEMH